MTENEATVNIVARVTGKQNMASIFSMVKWRASSMRGK